MTQATSKQKALEWLDGNFGHNCTHEIKETIRQSLSARQWRDISTAPMGELVMVWWKDGSWWGTRTDGRYNNGEHVWMVRFGDSHVAANPSHWRPLPDAPPSGGEGK